MNAVYVQEIRIGFCLHIFAIVISIANLHTKCCNVSFFPDYVTTCATDPNNFTKKKKKKKNRKKKIIKKIKHKKKLTNKTMRNS